eukprot:COSAG05_NODE_37_length_27688_cov_18.080394_19_plen_209_part_00
MAALKSAVGCGDGAGAFGDGAGEYRVAALESAIGCGDGAGECGDGAGERMVVLKSAIGCLRDELFTVFTFLGADDLLKASHVCCEWRDYADDRALWLRHCACLWEGKSYVPQQFLQVTGSRALPRKKAYFQSRRDACRSGLRVDELCQFTWERIRNDATQRRNENVDLDEHTQNKDPSRILVICSYVYKLVSMVSMFHDSRALLGYEG